MVDAFTNQEFQLTVEFTTDSGQPAQVDPNSIVWASSDETVLTVTPNADKMSAVGSTVAPGGPARFSVTADADTGTEVRPIIGVTDDVMVTPNPKAMASIVKLTLGPATDKV